MPILLVGGKPLLVNGRLLAATAGAAAEAPPPPQESVTLTLTDIDKDQRLFQRDDAGFYDIAVAGTSSAANAVQARAVDAYSGAVVVDWTSIGTPSGGAFSGVLRCPARISPMKLEIRDSVSTASTKAGANRFYVGAFWFLMGQSNAVSLPSTPYHYPLGGKGSIQYKGGAYIRLGWTLDTYPPSTRHGSYYAGGYPGSSATVHASADRGDAYIYMANVLSESLGCAVCMVQVASGGKPIDYFLTGGTGWTDFNTALAAIGGDAEGVIYYQGEADADAGMTKTTYLSKLGTLHSQYHTATGRTADRFKFGLVSLGSVSATSVYIDSIDQIRAAQVEYAGSTAGAFLAAANQDCKTSDGVHVVGISYAHLGAQLGRSMAARYGIGASGAGPRVVSATRSGAVVTLNVQHAGGTALLDGAGGNGATLKGFRVFDNGTPATISATSIASATTIQLTLSAVPSGTVTVDYAMIPAPHAPDLSDSRLDPDLATAVYDNVALINHSRGCILQPFAAITVTGA